MTEQPPLLTLCLVLTLSAPVSVHVKLGSLLRTEGQSHAPWKGASGQPDSAVLFYEAGVGVGGRKQVLNGTLLGEMGRQAGRRKNHS